MTPGDRPAGGWTRAEVLRESARWVHVPPSGTRVEDGERFLVLMPPGGGASRVWRSNPRIGRAGPLIRQTIADARAHGAGRLAWHTGDGVSPPFVEDLLLKHGFVMTEELEVLAFDLGTNRLLPDLRVPPDVRVRTVEDGADLRHAHAVESRVFPSSTPDTPDVRSYLLGLAALRGEAPDAENVPRAFRCLAAVRPPAAGQWEVAAAAGAEVSGRTVRLWGAATLPKHRRRGAYRALVTERCRHASALGATLALAKANTATSAPILRAAGFQAVARERRYALDLAL